MGPEAQQIPLLLACTIAVLPPALLAICFLRRKQYTTEVRPIQWDVVETKAVQSLKFIKDKIGSQEINGIGEPNTKWSVVRKRTKKGVQTYFVTKDRKIRSYRVDPPPKSDNLPKVNNNPKSIRWERIWTKWDELQK